jgi:3-deoxy-manno-octulosonate cytidylyltransferase (CMP-KDO synthetase)
MNIIAVIPARFASIRFPGKPLVEIDGKSMIQRVYEQAQKVNSFSEVIIATDDLNIQEHGHSFGAKVIMTSDKHRSGTDRCAEVATLIPDAEIIVNIQGDEPFINPLQIEELIECFKNSETTIATLIKRITSEEELFNTSTPKVVIDKNLKALYFSRNTIPFQRNFPKEQWLNSHTYYKHIGIYGFRATTLKEITSLPTSPLESSESLEQLRWLENGYSIQTAITEFESFGIDHIEDIEKVLKQIKNLSL